MKRILLIFLLFLPVGLLTSSCSKDEVVFLGSLNITLENSVKTGYTITIKDLAVNCVIESSSFQEFKDRNLVFNTDLNPGTYYVEIRKDNSFVCGRSFQMKAGKTLSIIVDPNYNTTTEYH